MISPIFALEKINTAKKAVEAIGDTSKLARLEVYRKAVVALSVSTNVGIAIYSANSGFEAIQELIKDEETKKSGINLIKQ